jgi:hypothetical protein
LDLPLALHRSQFRDATAKLLRRVEDRRQICRNEIVCEPRTNDLSAYAHYVYIIMLHSLMGRMYVMADGRSYASDLVGSDRGTDTGATDYQSALGLRRCHGLRNLTTDIGKIYRVLIETADVNDFVTGISEEVDHTGLQNETRMIRTNHNSQVASPLQTS